MRRTVSVFLTANVRGFTSGVAAASAELRQLPAAARVAAADTNKSLSSISASQRQTLKTMSTWAALAGVAILATAGLFAKAAVDVERNMRNVQTIMADDRGQKLTERGFQDVTSAVVDMSRTVPQSAATLSSGLYDIVSSGFQGSQAMTILRQSAMAASAGLTDTATAGRGIVSVLNAYGLGASSAAHVSDVLFQTVNLGVITFEQLSNTIGQFIGTARVAGVSIEEANAALATMTLSGLDAFEAGTSLNRVVQAFIKPSDAMTNALRSMNFESGQQAIQALGLHGVMNKLAAGIGNNAAAWADLFPELRGVRGALALTANDGKTYERVLAGLTDTTQVANATQRAFEIQSKGTGFQLEVAKNQVMAAGIAVGQGLLPVLRVGASLISAFALGWASIPGPVRSTAVVITLALGAVLLITAGIMRANLALTNFSAKLRETGAVGGAFATSISFAARALGIVGIALTAYSLIQSGGAKAAAEHKAQVQELTDALLQEGQAAIDAAKNLVIKNLVEADGIKNARSLGIAIEDVVGAAMGDKGALARVAESLTILAATPGVDRGKLEKLAQAIGLQAVAYGDATDKANQTREAQKAAGVSTGDTTGAIQQQKAALDAQAASAFDASGAMVALSASQEGLQKTIQGATGIASAWDEITASQSASEKQAKKQAKAQVKSAAEIESAQIGVERALLRVDQAVEDRNRVEREHANLVFVVAKAERELQAAYDAQTRAVFDVLDAERALEDARRARAEGRDVTQAEFGLARARDAQASAAEDTVQAELKLAAAQDHGTPEELAQSTRELTEAQRRQKEAAWAVEDAEVALRRAQQDVASNRAVVVATMDLTAAQRGNVDAADAAREATQALADAQARAASTRDLVTANLDLRDAINGVAQARESLTNAMKPAEDSMDSFSTSTDKAKVSVSQLIDKMREHVDAALKFSDNLAFIAQNGGPPFMVRALQGMGDKGIEIAGQLRQMPGQIKPMYDVMVADAIVGTGTWAQWVEAKTQQGKTSAEFWTGAMVTSMANQLGVAPDKAKEILDKYLGIIAGELEPLTKPWFGDPSRWDSPLHGWYKLAGGRARGGIDAHVTSSPTVLYGERSTGGEAFIPRRGISRGRGLDILSTAAGWYGAKVQAMAAGGVNISDPPYDQFAPLMRHGGLPAMRAAQQAQLLAVALGIGGQAAMAEAQGRGTQAASVAAGPPGAGPFHDIVSAGRAIQAMGFLVGENPAFGGVAPVHTRGSYHYQGRAVDVNWSGADEAGHLDSLAGWIRGNVSPVTELLWRVAGHFDHLHLAMRRGGIVSQVLDDGGYLPKGWSLAGNFTGRPEPVGRASGLVINVQRGAVTQHVAIGSVVDAPELQAKLDAASDRSRAELVSDIVREVQRI